MADTELSLGARVARLMQERARKIERLRTVEWAFDRNLTADYAKELRLLRDAVSDLEDQIVAMHNLQKMMSMVHGDTRDELESRTMVLPAKRTLPVQRIGEKR